MKLSEAVELYISLRDKKAEIVAEAKSRTDPIQEKLDSLEVKLLAAFQQAGMDSVKTSAGTAYTTTRTTMSVADRDSFVSHIREKGLIELLDVRVNKAAAEAYADEHGELPPGINARTERVVNVRRSN